MIRTKDAKKDGLFLFKYRCMERLWWRECVCARISGCGKRVGGS